jgi:uncharacterized protein YecE (DUF72 family)
MSDPRNAEPRARGEKTSSILIGTSGFSYAEWVGPVYPPGASSRDFFPLYAAEFPLVELNYSYYTQPESRSLDRMVQRAPPGFLFSIKAHQSLTHDLSSDFPSALRAFQEGIRPLRDASRLAAVLAQFPYSFHYTPSNRRHLQAVCAGFEGLPLAVEFRNREWQRESVYEGLRRYGAALVCVDEPNLPNLPRPEAAVTAPLAYLRFHGRNSAAWWQGDNASRYEYLYNQEELFEWIPRIRLLAGQATLLLVTFNNHRRGYAVQNARDLQRLLFPPA